jgi:hypothetical protein
MLEIHFAFYPPELGVAGIYSARCGLTQTTAASPMEALRLLERELAHRFPRPMPRGNLFVQGAE